MEQIVNDADSDAGDDTPLDEPVAAPAEEPVDQAGDEPTVDDTPDGPAADSDDTISGEQARKLRSEASNLRHRLREAEGELEKLRAEVSERDERLSAAESGRLDAMIYSRAAGKLQNPADAVVFLDRGDLSADDVGGIDAAIDALLDERTYLRAGGSIPQVDQGVQREKPRAKSFGDVMAEGLGWTGR